MRIDLNSDMGESFGNWVMGDDEQMLDLVSSANIACGFHAGDATVMVRTCHQALARGVTIGAHVSYRDLAGFGRNYIDVAPEVLYADVVYQLAAIGGVARTVGARIGYVKPHGALYNTIVKDREQAGAVVRAVADFSQSVGSSTLAADGLGLLGLPGSVVLAEAQTAGLDTFTEAFVDRAYNPDGTLVSRRQEGAVLTDPDQVAERMVKLVTRGSLTAVDGTEIELAADSLCVHGDSPGAVAMASRVRTALGDAGVELAPFVS